MSRLAALAGLPHHRFAAAVTARASSALREVTAPWDVADGADTAHGKFGVAILSRYEILETRVLRYARYGAKTPRNALAVRVRLPGGTELWVVSTHLGMCLPFVANVAPWRNPGGLRAWVGFGEQAAQARELVAWARALPAAGSGARLIVLGDFNALPCVAASRTMRGAFCDAHRACGNGGRGATFPAGGGCLSGALRCCGGYRLDYCYYDAGGGALEATRVRVPETIASDHRPLVVDFVVCAGIAGGGDDGRRQREPATVAGTLRQREPLVLNEI